MFGLFNKKEPQLEPQADSEERKELKKIWESLDQDLKDFAKETRDLGLSRNLKTRLNEVGMANLVKQLDEIGYEIREKEQKPSHQIYAADIDDIETVDQLREFVKILLRSLGGNSARVMIRENHVDEFPSLAKIVYRVNNNE